MIDAESRCVCGESCFTEVCLAVESCKRHISFLGYVVRFRNGCHWVPLKPATIAHRLFLHLSSRPELPASRRSARNHARFVLSQ